MLFAQSAQALNIPWEPLEGMLKGTSALEMSRMGLNSLNEAQQFLANYGYDWSLPQDREALSRIQSEAVSFIQRRFLDAEVPWQTYGVEVCDAVLPSFLFDDDARQLLVVASTQSGVNQHWACATLKVMHILSHLNNSLLHRTFRQAKQQILSRYNQVLSQTQDGELLLGQKGDLQLSLVGFEVKDEKSRDSMVLKLLSKRENVAEEVFDMIGIRLITHTPAEALMALEVLRRNNVLIFPNIIPSRSRNALINFETFKLHYEGQCKAAYPDIATLLSGISQIQATDTQHFNPNNQATLGTYHAIHITERQLVRFIPEGSDIETRFFFPYELQVVDEANYHQNRSGSSAHALYKQNQLIQARRRVMGPLFVALRKHSHHDVQAMVTEPTV